jgi:hypothetical protein
VIITRDKENGLYSWPQQWTNTRKGAVTKAFFPKVRNRLDKVIPIFPEFITMVTGHGKLKSYFYRFGLTDDPTCLCEEDEQTVDHLLFRCKKLKKQRNEMIRQIKKTLVAIGQRLMKHLLIIIYKF